MPTILFYKKKLQTNPKFPQRVGHKKDHPHLKVVYCYEDSYMYGKNVIPLLVRGLVRSSQ